jgi:hypothetical protein
MVEAKMELEASLREMGDRNIVVVVLASDGYAMDGYHQRVTT